MSEIVDIDELFMTNKELLDLVLKALRSAAAELYRASSYCNTYEVLGNTNDAITAIQQARSAQPAQQKPVGTYGEIFESMRSLLQSGRQADQQIYMAMQHKPLYTSPPAQPAPVHEPVAWRYDLAKYRENDLRGRQWAHSVFSPTKPYIDEMVRNLTPLYTTPPAAQRQWVGLTDQEIRDTYEWCSGQSEMDRCRAIEAKLKEKNT